MIKGKRGWRFEQDAACSDVKDVNKIARVKQNQTSLNNKKKGSEDTKATNFATLRP